MQSDQAPMGSCEELCSYDHNRVVLTTRKRMVRFGIPVKPSAVLI